MPRFMRGIHEFNHGDTEDTEFGMLIFRLCDLRVSVVKFFFVRR